MNPMVSAITASSTCCRASACLALVPRLRTYPLSQSPARSCPLLPRMDAWPSCADAQYRGSAIPNCAPLKYIIPSKNQPTSPHPETPGHARRQLMPKKKFKDLTEREILALAIQLEEEDSRVYADFADGLKETYPATARVFEDMQVEESRHRQSLIDMYQRRFGDHIPLIRPMDVKGFVERRPVWLVRPLGIAAVRKQVEVMEQETMHFYERAMTRISDPSTRKLLGDLAEIERQHENFALGLEEKHLTEESISTEDRSQRQLFMLQIIQPGLAGLMDGSVSTLAPIFAAAFATRSTRAALLVGLAASLGAGISMAFAEALSDDGSLTGRGRPIIRGTITGLMTTAGGLGHTLPFLISSFHVAFTVAMFVVAVELAVISYIRHRYMDTPLLSSTMQVVVGGVAVFIVGILIGSS